jgi:hypothetical protein
MGPGGGIGIPGGKGPPMPGGGIGGGIMAGSCVFTKRLRTTGCGGLV